MTVVLSSDFQRLRISAVSMTLTASTASVASMTLTASFHNFFTEFYVSINLGTKMTYPGLSMWNGSSKPTILLIFGNLSLGSCEGHPMRPKLNLKDKGQMSKPTQITSNPSLKCNIS